MTVSSRIRRWLAALSFLCAVAGGHAAAQTDLTTTLNSLLPKVSEQGVRDKAIADAWRALDAQGATNLVASFGTDALAASLRKADALKTLGVGNIAVSGDRQILHATATIERTLDENSFPMLPDAAKALLRRFHPHVVADIDAGLAVGGGLAGDSDKEASIRVSLVPLFRQLTVRSFKVDSGAGPLDLTVVGAAFASTLNVYAESVTAAIVQQNLWNVAIPAIPFPAQDFSQSIHVRDKDGSTLAADIKTRPVSFPVRVTSVATLVDAERIAVVAGLAPPAAASTAPSATAARGFDQLKAEISERAGRLLGGGTPTGDGSIAVAKPLVAALINSVFAQANVCVAANGVLAEGVGASRLWELGVG